MTNSAAAFNVTPARSTTDELVAGAGYDGNGDLILRLSSFDAARRAWKRAALRYATRILRELGYDGAAKALDLEVERRTPRPASATEYAFHGAPYRGA